MNDHLQEIALNAIHVQRKSLDWDDAVAVWLLHWRGEKQHVIAAKFGTNAGRVADVLTEKKHAGSRAAAFSMMSG